MSDIAIRVENLGKRYRIGTRQARYATIRETVTDLATAPLRRLRHLGQPTPAEETIWALKDVSFEVKHGEVLGIIGRNGAGKTTLLRVLCRITDPTEGYAEIHGRVGSLLEVGTGFHPELTGRENIHLNGAILGMKKAEIERKFDEIVDFAEIEKFLDTPVKRYSSGMYVRLAFAVAAHLEPEILLVDEVLAVGDAGFQKKCLGKMEDVAKEGRTVLFVSHNMIALRNLCPKAIWLEGGHISEGGPSQDVVSNYLKLLATNVYEQAWDDRAKAPGNDKVRLHRVWIEPDDGTGDAGMPRETPLTVGVEYWHLDPTAQLHVTLQVYVEQQIVAFTTSSGLDSGWQGVTHSGGLVRSTCRIPAHFLNTGQHRINVHIVRDRSTVIHRFEDALSFDVVETEQRSGAWFGRVAGVVRPTLRWRTKCLGGPDNECAPRDP